MPVDLAVVPVAGRGTRLLPLTKSQPKEMLPVGRKPVVQYVVEELVRCGIGRVLFVTGPGKTAIENHFDIDGELVDHLRESGKEELLEELAFEREQVQYFYTRQRRQLGLGHAVLCAQPAVGNQPFVVALGDSIIGLHAQSSVVRVMIERFEECRADAVIALEPVARQDVIHYGIAKLRDRVPGNKNAHGPSPSSSQHRDPTSGAPGPTAVWELDDLIEKPDIEEAPSTLAVAARYVFSPVIFDYLARTEPGKGGEIQLTDAVRLLIREGGKVLGVSLPAGEKRFDIGNFESYFEAFVEFALADRPYGEPLRARLAQLLSGQQEAGPCS